MGPEAFRLDLDGESRSALEFDALLTWVASFARTGRGALAVTRRAPGTDLEAIRAAHAAVAEIRRRLHADGAIVPARLPDPDEALAGLDVSGARVLAQPLRDLATVVSSVGEVARGLRGLDETEFPLLRALVDSVPDLRLLCREVLDGIDPEGNVLDAASPELARIRRSARRVGERLRAMLERRLHAPGAESVIRDDFVTQRNGRYVIPVRVDAPHGVRGIVHASSSSGVTRFVEPLETVELNNELVRLAEQEQEEQSRLLAAWSAEWRARLPEVHAAVDALEQLDDLQARALFGEAIDAVAPTVRADGGLRLLGVRHALLDRRLREEGGCCEPLDLSLDPAHQVLVVSGPNTGGKTVALKTIGLSVLMAQTGIPVPASDFSLPVYRQLRADIGDHQSIQADLSTYSAHVGAIVGFLRHSEEPAILLFDEIGTGTEPGEGAALARAVLETLVGRAVTAVATTHLGALKTWAVGSEGVVSAAMEFDEESLRPTYRIVTGAAGVSAGLQIAQRLGLDPELLARARELLDPNTRESERHLRRMRELVHERESEQRELRRQRAQLEDERRSALAESERRARQLEREAAERIERVLEKVDEQARAEIAALTDARERARLEKRWSRSASRVRGTAAQLRPRSVTAAGQAVGGPLDEREARPGARVHVGSLGREGEIVERRGDRVVVRVGAVQVEVPLDTLRAAPTGSAGRSEGGRRRPSAETLRGLESGGPGRELQILGCTVDEGLAELDKFLDNAVMAGYDEVRVVHGHGTGRLRSSVRRFLDGHSQVAGHRPGGDHEGGNGATIVRLV